MSAEQLIAKWRANTRMERAACQEHFIDLCNLVHEPTPNTDPDGSTYAFEKGATKATGGDGWADVWRRGCFAWEYKGKHRDLDAAYRQLLQYSGALSNPPLLVVSDIERIVVRTNWTNAVSERHDLLLGDLADPAKRFLLKSVLSDPDRLRPAKTREALTQQAAGEFAELAKRLRARGEDAQLVAHFINRLVFCLFADDVGLLPAGLLEQMIAASKRSPGRFAEFARELFGAMARKGGRVGYTAVQWFNGGLFDDDRALALEGADIELLERVAELDWAEIDPSILGTLFERGLDPDKRSQLGAHYTDRDKIEMLVDPVIRRPLLAEWTAVKGEIEAVLAGGARVRRGRGDSRRLEAERKLRGFLDKLRAFRVLDPACGSGNFLYLSLRALKDLEHLVSVEAEALGLQREFPQIGPEAVLGIEINPYAAELARVSVWIGHIQWARRHGLPPPSDPVLKPLETIECRDAVLTEDGKRAVWPKADAIVGNPPFLGDKAMLGVMGPKYTRALRAAYSGSVPGGADLVCYWFEQARSVLRTNGAERAGLVATNSIRGGANRAVLDAIRRDLMIYDAWSDEAWAVEGAAVRVSLICYATSPVPVVHLNGRAATRIAADLTTGATDLTTASAIKGNAKVAFSGIQKTGPFELPGRDARALLLEPTNPNGNANSDVVRPWWNGLDVTRRARDMWIIDFGLCDDESAVAGYALPYARLAALVKPTRFGKREARTNRCWWLFQWPRPVMRHAIADLKRFIVTPEVSKHRVFVWAPATICPDKNLVVIARDDDTTFGILHSRFHELWALALGTSLEDRPRYTPTSTFETFPFPQGFGPGAFSAGTMQSIHAETIAAAARVLVEARDRWLNPPELVKRVPEVVPGYPDRILPIDERAAGILKTRTLTNLYNIRGTPAGAWLDNLHRALDEAVAAAYGWPADLPDEEVLARLLALNHERSGVAVGRCD